jgi:hypothetical protein
VKRFLQSALIAAFLPSLIGAAPSTAQINAAKPERGSSKVLFVLTPCSGGSATSTVSFAAMHHGPSEIVTKDVVVKSRLHPTMAVELRTGGYTAQIYSGNCRANIMFGVLAGFNRTIRVALSHPRSDGNSHAGDEAYIYVRPTGFIAGKTLSGASVKLRSASGRMYVPTVENGAFYFDRIPAGDYDLIVAGAHWKKVRRINAPANYALRTVSIRF